jgi:enamine deaminase RidA (YjgF/YER057c/UK114 family)
MPNDIKAALTRLDLQLPTVNPPASALFLGYKRSGNLVFISGQLPLKEGKPTHLGRLGEDVTIEDGVLAARQCALNVLAQLELAIGGDWDKLVQAIRVGGFVNCLPSFYDAPLVINGASRLFIDVLGEAGRHARAAIGVASLPANAAVEVEATFEVRD